jgi:hypothetical protein
MATETPWAQGRRRLDAEHYVGVLGILATSALGLVTAWTLLAGVVLGLLPGVVMAAVPGAVTALVGWLTAAWRRDEPWSWVAWTVLSLLGILGGLAGVAGSGPSWGDVVTLGVGALSLILLLHPDSRARLSRMAPPAGGQADGGRCRPSSSP